MAHPRASDIHSAGQSRLRHAELMRLPAFPRYGAGAALYDVVSFEKPVYRVGRVRAIDHMGLREGDTVLDIGCGTGLNFDHLRRAIGPDGHIVGVDASASMLAQAKRKFDPTENVDLIHGDAGLLADLVSQWTFDAAIATYSMSIIPQWQSAWAGALARTRSGGRIAIVDLALPRGRGRVLDPAARLACFTGGVDLDRKPWTLVDDQLDNVALESHRWGHVVLAVGTTPTIAAR